MSRPLTQSDLIFPTQSLSISSTLSSLKRSALSTHNRLSSIQFDADFVASVSDAYGLPLVANERCGSWYISPERKAESVYFKSTDGHTNEWKFSVRRLNLQVLDLVGKSRGCVIVDSTRRGKSMPDALSKTIPIWCCVMNRALFADTGNHELHTPPQAVSESEHAQIEKRIEGFVRDFLDICKPDIELLRRKIQKPLRPIWVTQKSSLPDEPPLFSDFHPMVLCTASRRVNGAEGSEGGYIQGAADDHEAWSLGLTPTLFWSNKEQLLNTNEEDLADLIGKLIKEEKSSDVIPILIKPTSNLYISSSQNLDLSPFDVIINCGPKPLPEHVTEPMKLLELKHHIWLECQSGKTGSRNLRDQLWRLRMLEEWLGPEPTTAKILVCDPQGRDLAVGVALAILCNYANATGTLAFRPKSDDWETSMRDQPDKKLIKERLSWITTTHPTLNPPRETLKSVNAYLMPSVAAKIEKQPGYMSRSKSLYGVGNGKALEESVRKIVPRMLLEPSINPPPPEPPSPPQPDLLPIPPDAPSRIFAALQNGGKPWNLFRELTSQLSTHPSGTVQGIATFTPHASSPDTLLYAEEGEFTTTTGLRMNVRRKYIYILKKKEGSQHIAVHFHEEGKDIGGLFVEMDELSALGPMSLKAENKKQHLCGQDLYTAHWEFPGSMIHTRSEWVGGWSPNWGVTYNVKGPKKDYVSETSYT